MTGTSPVLLHVGLHKTGSTFLQRTIFNVHEAFAAVDRQTIERFIVDPPRMGFDPAAANRAAHEAAAVPPGSNKRVILSHERLLGHPFSGGFDSEVIADRLSQSFPDARVLIVLRRQEDLLRAVYAQYVRRGGPLRLSRFVAESENWHRQPHFRFDFFEYDVAVQYYQYLFGPENVSVACYELLRDSPDEFLAVVAGFAQVDHLSAAESAVVNRSLSSGSLGLNRFVNRVISNPGFNRGASILDATNYSRAGRALRMIDDRFPKPFRDRAERRQKDKVSSMVAGKYAASNQRTMALTGLDLGSFGYQV